MRTHDLSATCHTGQGFIEHPCNADHACRDVVVSSTRHYAMISDAEMCDKARTRNRFSTKIVFRETSDTGHCLLNGASDRPTIAKDPWADPISRLLPAGEVPLIRQGGDNR
jgi:hypothetical protein